jgi:hypothetical protein
MFPSAAILTLMSTLSQCLVVLPSHWIRLLFDLCVQRRLSSYRRVCESMLSFSVAYTTISTFYAVRVLLFVITQSWFLSYSANIVYLIFR